MQMSCLKLCFVSEHGAVNDVSKQPQLPGNPLSKAFPLAYKLSRAANYLPLPEALNGKYLPITEADGRFELEWNPQQSGLV